MKRATTLLVLLMVTGSTAASLATGLPTSVCSEKFCGPRQEKIWNRFLQSSGLDHNRIPGMYSGICFHKSPAYDADQAHYGGILIDRSSNRLFFDGRFSFYITQNPYIHLNVHTARKHFDKLFHPTHELEIRRSFAFIDFKGKLTSFRYWFRQDRNNDRLLLVGYFGPRHTILCDLERNPD